MSMSPDLRARLLPRLKADYQFKQNGDWLQNGKCPACGKKELFTSTENPWILRCGRANKCGAEFSVQSLYPEEFGKFNERHPATAENPNATADAYMSEARGLNVMRCKGYYSQEKFFCAGGDKGTATVRFPIAAAGADVYMERFVEPVTVSKDGGKEVRKQNFGGKHGGYWWQPSDMKIAKDDEVWITEAIIDSISLWQSGIKSVAILSCGNYPQKSLAALKCARDVRWVIALDNDAAGKAATLKHVKKMRDAKYNVSAVQVPRKSKADWNDLFKADRLRKEDIEDYRYYGALLIAESASDKAALMYQHTKRSKFILDFGDQLYEFSCKQENVRALVEQGDMTEHEAIKTAGTIVNICNARPDFLYFQRNETTDESWIFAKVHFPDARQPMNLTFSPAQATAVGEFKKRLFSAHGVTWEGKDNALNYLLKYKMNNLPRVDTITYFGYSKEYDAYVFPRIAVYQGEVYAINAQDFFQFPRLSLKSLASEAQMQLETAPDHYRQDWPQLVWRAYGAKGMIACVFWFASLFCEQIRKAQSSYPFLEIIGDPGSGKTTLIEFIWRLFGRDNEEGFDPNKGTRAGIDRKLKQFSGLPVVFIEADRAEDSHAKKFDWDEVKPYYNGRGLRVRGVRNGGNDTSEEPFRGSLVIAQNDPVSASDAVLERIVQLRFSVAGHSADGKIAADEMNKLSIEQLSYFVILATRRAKEIADYINERTDAMQAWLLKQEGVEHARLAKNHGQLLAALKKFAELVGLSDAQLNETTQMLVECCRQRQVAIAADHPLVAEFWEIFDYLNNDTRFDARGNPLPAIDHSSDPKEIWVNLNEFVQVAAEARQQVPPLIDLKRLLKTSKSRKFIAASEVVRSAITNKPRRCWRFQNPQGAN